MSGINARTEYELNAGGEPVKNATYWKRQHDKLADRIVLLEAYLKSEENRIAELEADIDKKLTLIKMYEATHEPKKQSEPVAWISIDVEQGKTIGFEKKQWAEIHIPLYTTPQTKPLSDEEIVQLKAEIVAHKKTNELLAQKIEQLEKELSK